jgi:hypothetical protein
MSTDVVEERSVFPLWHVHVGRNDSWRVMWSQVVNQLPVPQNRSKILEFV